MNYLGRLGSGLTCQETSARALFYEPLICELGWVMSRTHSKADCVLSRWILPAPKPRAIWRRPCVNEVVQVQLTRFYANIYARPLPRSVPHIISGHFMQHFWLRILKIRL